MQLKHVSTLAAAIALAATATLSAQQWREWRGPARDGRSAQTGLPESWSTSGDALAWRIPLGGRATPVAFGDRLYLLTTAGDFAHTQERLVALDAATGKELWDLHFSLYLSDVPQNRAAWAPPAVDAETGNIYVFTVAAELFAISPEGRILWSRSLPEEYGAITTHGGRTTPPIVEGDKVITNALIMAWGDLGRPGNRYFAFDKTTGQTVWVSSPQARHYDTNFSTPIVADVAGMRQMIVGGTDGQFYGLEVNTGDKVWQIEVSKRAILNSALYRDGIVYFTHGEENIGRTEMGMVAALPIVDETGKPKTGQLGLDALKWVTYGFLPTFPSPVMDDERLYVLDNGAILAAFDLETGTIVWQRSLGTLQKGSPVLADGKLYVGTENGKLYILRPSATGVEVVHEQALPNGSLGTPEAIVASPIVAHGRVYLTSMDSLYAIGDYRNPEAGALSPEPGQRPEAGRIATVQVFPYEALLSPGETQSYSLKLYDEAGNFVREARAADATWALGGGLQGSVSVDGTYTAPSGDAASAGVVTAAIDGVTGQARVRVMPPLPWSYDFENPASADPPTHWIGARGKVTQETVEGVGNVLIRKRDDTVGRRAKIIMGRPDWSGLTVQADVRGRVQRRQRGDLGLINQRYILTLFGNAQKLELQPWQAADEMTVRIPFEWNPDAWYTMKLRVDNLADGTVHVRGKVWPTGTPEPDAWTIEKIDTIGHTHGAPGLYADGISDVYFDNVQVKVN